MLVLSVTARGRITVRTNRPEGTDIHRANEERLMRYLKTREPWALRGSTLANTEAVAV